MTKHEAGENASDKENFKWTEYMDNAFIQSMKTQDDNGYRINGTFTPQAYKNMVEELSTKLQMKFTISLVEIATFGANGKGAAKKDALKPVDEGS
ncbi:hypothetical protein L1987_60724 [Smallanthus sonchifolius]|uniref:Uncharacterized protein n=1 Tax=Smallanthus sonchifolius TaxID=185202 RepID=A0ACB9D980_9ASTR|nr:hypothetical protein L1987_60724 [Smallanthus sonchifolius]